MASRKDLDQPRAPASPSAARPASPPGRGAKTAPGPQEGLSADDLRDIEGLLDQSPDLTRQDIPAQSLEQLLASFPTPPSPPSPPSPGTPKKP